jgi:ankyrin repeat protein
MRPTLPCVALLGLVLLGCQKPTPVTPAPQEPSGEPAAKAPAPPTGASERYAERTRMLLTAAEKGQISLLRELLKDGGDVNDKNDVGDTALHRAAAQGQRSAVAVLLVHGADLAAKDAQGRTPIMRAAEEGHAETLKLLLQPSLANQQAATVLTALPGEAAKSLPGGEGAKALLERLGQSLDDSMETRDKLGQTALMKAAAKGQVDCVAQLFASNSAVRGLALVDREGKSALHWAAQNGQADVIEWLTEHVAPRLALADLRRPDHVGKTPQDLAEASGKPASAVALRNALFLAVAHEGDAATLRKLWKPEDISGRTLKLCLTEASTDGLASVVRFLLETQKDKSPDEKLRLMSEGGTMIDFAIHSNRPLVAEALLDPAWWKDKAVLAAYLNQRNGSGATPLEHAEQSFPMYGIHPKPEIAALIKKRLEEATAGK